jgi:hypothetical protein
MRKAIQIIDKSQCKCLADQVLLYIRYACPRLTAIADHKLEDVQDYSTYYRHIELDNGYQERRKHFQEYAEHLYKELVRGDIITNPRTVAAGLLYVAGVLSQTYFSQGDIAEVLGVNEVTVRNAYQKIKVKGQKQGTFT